jgi:hypothetical protein
MKLLAATAVTFGVLVLTPAGASAGVARVEYVQLADPRAGTSVVVSYKGSGGERNDVTVTQGEGKSVVFHDAGAPVVVFRCDRIDDHTARCDPGDLGFGATIEAGDGDDRVTVVDAYAFVLGGRGDDRLVGGSKPAELDGGSGSDVLKGGPADDTLVGGAGRDRLAGGEGGDILVGDGFGAKPATDVIDGGPGVDSASYRERKAPVFVDLRRSGDQGAAGEGDTFTRVEGAQGGQGADVFIGDDGPNVFNWFVPQDFVLGRGDRIRGLGGDDRLAGSRGDDLLDGGDGNDVLGSGAGHDRLLAGRGDDVLALEPYDPRHPLRAVASCGPGFDRVKPPSARVVVPRQCERTVSESVDISTARWTQTRGALELPMRAAPPYYGFSPVACEARVMLQDSRGRALGSATVPLSRVADTAVQVPLNAAGRRLVARRGRVPVRVATLGRYGCDSAPYDDASIGAFTLLL